LPQLFVRVHIADEVYREVVVLGEGRPAAGALAAADWIEVHPAADASAMAALRTRHALGAGELATVLLSQSLQADPAILNRSLQAVGLPGV